MPDITLTTPEARPDYAGLVVDTISIMRKKHTLKVVLDKVDGSDNILESGITVLFRDSEDLSTTECADLVTAIDASSDVLATIVTACVPKLTARGVL